MRLKVMLFLCFTSLTAVVYFCFKQSSHNVSFVNKGSQAVIVKRLYVDGKLVTNEETIVAPNMIKEQGAAYASFNAEGRHEISVDIKGGDQIFLRKMCVLAESKDGCLVKIYFSEKSSVTCICDPYSDF